MPTPLCLSDHVLRPAIPLSSDQLDVQREYLAQACAAADAAEDEVKELQEQVSLWRTDHGRLYRSNKC
jgi:hypothetical protein